MPGDDAPGGLGFGRTFTAHMVVATFDGAAWSEPSVVPFGDLQLSPAAMVFHYGQAVFEGLKAFRQPDGDVALFRPADHASRFDRSAARLAMPALAPGLFEAACAALVQVDAAAVPAGPGESLYLRPMMLATEVGLGVRPASTYLFAVIASPVGSYFPNGLRPVQVWATDRYVRAAPGGTGAAKCAGNYAGSLAAKAEAAAEACDETLFLDAAEHRWVEELGGMNVVFVANGRGRAGRDDRPVLVTPPAEGTILDGVTLRSLLALAGDLGYGADQRPVALDEVRSGAFTEAFACGTAAVVAPIGTIRTTTGPAAGFGSTAGPVTVRLREALIGVQEGRAADRHGWRVPVVGRPSGTRIGVGS